MKSLFTVFVVALVTIACSRAKDEPSRQTSGQKIKTEFQHYTERLVSMLDSGWVVSRNASGGAEHTGDSLIWSGFGLAFLDCKSAEPIEDALISMLQETGGKLYRHPSLKGEISLDGAIGLYLGVAVRVNTCDGTLEKWKAVAAEFPSFGKDPLNNTAGTKLQPEWTVLRELLEAKLTGSAAPSALRIQTLETEVATWAEAVKSGAAATSDPAKKPACFRVNLGWATFKTLEALGAGPSQTGRDAFCAAASGLALPLVQSYCGDSDAIPTYVSSFTENQWEFRHQRCTDWETPDGSGLETPALDLIAAIQEGYKVYLK